MLNVIRMFCQKRNTRLYFQYFDDFDGTFRIKYWTDLGHLTGVEIPEYSHLVLKALEELGNLIPNWTHFSDVPDWTGHEQVKVLSTMSEEEKEFLEKLLERVS